MIQTDQNTLMWRYLSPGQKGLLQEGLYLLNHARTNPDKNITDYSYLVFPFAKAYEGFLKQLFLDLGYINEHNYQSDHFRIGKVLNPNYIQPYNNDSVYGRISREFGENIANTLWLVWKKGRNQVFHYFPHNLHALTLAEAEETVNDVLGIMDDIVTACGNKLVLRS